VASTGAVFPTSGTTTSESPWLDEAWVNPGNILVDDATNAAVTATTFDVGDQTQVLKAFGFDFSTIPDGSTINGVTVRVEASADSALVLIDLAQLLDVSRAKVGTNLALAPTNDIPLSTSATVYTIGGASELWGNALTAAWVKDPDFGVAIGVRADTNNSQAFVDYVTIEIDFTPPAEGSFTVLTRKSPQSTAVTSHPVLLPQGSNVAGKRVQIWFACESASVVWPAGWTEIGSEDSTTATVLSIGERIIDGTEGFDGDDDSITVTTGTASLSNAHAYQITGSHASAAAEKATAATGSGANVNPPSLDPSWASEETLFITGGAYRFNSSFTAAPTNYTNVLSLSGGDTNAPLGTARRVVTATSDDPGTFTSADGGAWVAQTVAVRVGAGGGPVALDGDSEVVVEADGDLAVARPLDGSAGVIVETDGDLAVARPLAGSAEVVLEGDGELTVSAGGVVALDGTTGIIVEVFALSASLRVARAIDGQAEVVVGVSGNLVVAQALTGQTVVVVESDGELTVTAGGSVVALDGTAEIVLGDAAVLAMVVGLDGQTEVAIDTGTAELGVPQSVALEGQAEIVFDTADSNFRWRPETGGQRRRGWPRYANRRPGWG
jgi:hypothetical protein